MDTAFAEESYLHFRAETWTLVLLISSTTAHSGYFESGSFTPRPGSVVARSVSRTYLTSWLCTANNLLYKTLKVNLCKAGVLYEYDAWCPAPREELSISVVQDVRLLPLEPTE